MKAKKLFIYRRYGGVKFFSKAAEIEVTDASEIPQALKGVGFRTIDGELLLLQWQDNGSILPFRTKVTHLDAGRL